MKWNLNAYFVLFGQNYLQMYQVKEDRLILIKVIFNLEDVLQKRKITVAPAFS